MYTLGINAAYHDCSATLVRDGIVLAAAEEERFTRVKHGKRPVPFTTWQLPYYAIDYCLSVADIRLRDVDHIVYSYDPALLADGQPRPLDIALPLEPSRAGFGPNGESPWDPLFLSYLVNAPRQLLDGAPHHLKSPRFDDLTLEHILDRWVYLDHHLSHEASAFLAAP